MEIRIFILHHKIRFENTFLLLTNYQRQGSYHSSIFPFNWYHYQSLCKELLFFFNATRIALLMKQSKRMDGADSPSLEKLKICLHFFFFFCVHESTFAYTLCMLLFCRRQNCIHECISVICVHYHKAYECIQLHMNTFQTLQ